VALAAAGILPSATERYAPAAIEGAIAAAYGVRPRLNCDGRGALSELWLCVDRSLAVADCDAVAASAGGGGGVLKDEATCHGDVLIPPYEAAPPAGAAATPAGRRGGAAAGRPCPLHAVLRACPGCAVAGAALAGAAGAAGVVALRRRRAAAAAAAASEAALEARVPLLSAVQVHGAIAC